MESRRSAPLTSALILGACALLAVRFASLSPSFVGVSLRAAGPHRQVALRGLKEDLDEWRASLSDEERALVMEQAEGEFNKQFRKSDKYTEDLPEDKVKSFAKIMGKFFENEAEDYKKEQAARRPDYDGLLKKAGDKKMDFSLKRRIFEVDREADRRYRFATLRISEAQRNGEKFPQSSPQLEMWGAKNDDDESHAKNLELIEFIKKASEDKSCRPEMKAYLQEIVKNGIPAKGEPFTLELPHALVSQFNNFRHVVLKAMDLIKANKTEAEYKEIEEKVPEMLAPVYRSLVDKYVEARDEIQKDADDMKAFYRSAEKYKDSKMTKADVLKEIWAELPKYADKPVPPLDDETLAELAEEPAVIEGEFMHNWGTADKLWKSEAIDAFGQKYLLGVFENKDDAKKAFDDWNKQYEEARSTMKEELEQWGKSEQARLDADPEPLERIKKVLEEARR